MNEFQRKILETCVDLVELQDSLYVDEDDVWDDHKTYKIQKQVGEIIEATRAYMCQKLI